MKKTRKPIVNKKEKEPDELQSFIHNLAQDVNKTLGKTCENTLILGDEENTVVPYWIRTFIPSLDYAIGGYNHPGIPGGRIIETFGWEGAGKSTLVAWITKCAMEQLNTFAVYQDAERVLTDEIIEGTGINMEKVILQHPDVLEEVFDSQEAIIETAEKNGNTKPFIIVTDSIASCSTNSEINADYGESTMGIHARVMSQSMRKIKNPIFKNEILSLFVNQIREKIGVSFGKNYTTAGGKALPFYASVRLELTKIKTLKKDDIPYGCTVQAVVIKNKVAPPLKKALFDILFIEEKEYSYPKIDTIGAILDWCKDNKLIGGGTGRYSVNGKNLYKAQARTYLENNPEELQELIDLAYSITVENKNNNSNDDDDEE